MFRKKTRILIVGDRGPLLEWLKGRMDLFWPPDVPVKTLAMYCAWGNEAIEAVKEYQPDIVLLPHQFRQDTEGAREVARWIDQNHPGPLLVAVYSDQAEEDVRPIFADTACVTYFICGERVGDFVAYCLARRTPEGTYVSS